MRKIHVYFIMLEKIEVVGLYPARARPVGRRQGIAETLKSNLSERYGCLIDHDDVAAMEKRKQEGYFQC